MHPPDCPAWEYENHPKRQVVVSRYVAQILLDISTSKTGTLAVATDTRGSHRLVFEELTPTGYEYYAGHYRGESFRCLQFCVVRIQNDPRVGAAPESVAYRIGELNMAIRAGLMALDESILLPAKQRLHYIVALACHVFVEFLTIHPYANGNGHAGRLIVWSILARYGYWPRRWPVDPRPAPPYADLIMRSRSGDREPLEQYVLQTLF